MKQIVILVVVCLVGCIDPPATPSHEPPPTETPTAAEPTAPSVRRLTDSQYRNMVSDVLGVETAARLEPDLLTSGSAALGTTVSSVSPRGVEFYESASLATESFIGSARADLFFPCEDTSCHKQGFEQLGHLLWRRPLTDPELAVVVKIANAAESISRQAAIQYGLSYLLQSPNFLYRFDLANAEDETLNDHALLARITFLFWNSGPDAELMGQVSELSTPSGTRSLVRRIAADGRTRRGIRAFGSDWLALDKLDDLTKAPEVYEHIDGTVGPAAKEETLSLLERISFDRPDDFRQFLLTKDTILNRKLASIYNVRAPAREGFGDHTFAAEDSRRGFLGHVSFLALASHPSTTSPTLRGLYVRSNLLCQVVPTPPADVDTSIPEPTDRAPTLRGRITDHLQNDSCSSCHKFTDLIGLGFETYDGIGRYRTIDNGEPIDASGFVDTEPFDDFEGLSGLLADDPRFTQCVTKKLFEYATGQKLQNDTHLFFHDTFERSDFRLLSLMQAIATDDVFRKVKPDVGGAP